LKWQKHQTQWPTLFKLAMDLIPIQATSVPCERVFSSSKETARARRNRLGPRIMEATQILKFQAKNAIELTFTEGLGEKDEVTELEAVEAARPVEDLGAYLRGINE
jgi:hAT family C-terminal dimerisation region